MPSGPESGAGAEGLSAVERWKREADFYEEELARRSQIWEEREQALVNEIDMRDSELNALEHRVRKAALDMTASETARSESVSKAQQLAARAEELEERLSEALWSSGAKQEAVAKPDTSSDDVEKLRLRAQRAEEHVMRLGEMLASVCRQESQLVALLASAREQLRQLGCTVDVPAAKQLPAAANKGKNGQPTKQPLATNNTGVTDSAYRVSDQHRELNVQAKEQARSRQAATEHLWYAAQEAASLENEIHKLTGVHPRQAVTKAKAGGGRI